MTKESDKEALKKRIRIQEKFWSQVGAVEHVNLPKLEDAIKKEFGAVDTRFVQMQVRLMQSEGRIRVQDKAKIWIKQPEKV
ncbi:MAG: hypothetical protein ABSF44_01045 [Candidatus Bathyarchaeia archaeon]|jgi:hypothetical protein